MENQPRIAEQLQGCAPGSELTLGREVHPFLQVSSLGLFPAVVFHRQALVMWVMFSSCWSRIVLPGSFPSLKRNGQSPGQGEESPRNYQCWVQEHNEPRYSSNGVTMSVVWW